jgi:hypothetical protein
LIVVQKFLWSGKLFFCRAKIKFLAVPIFF